MTRRVTPQSVGVRNPYALAELVQGKKINWKRKSYDKSMTTLENTFGMPAERLFSPVARNKSPLYAKDITGLLPDSVLVPGKQTLCACTYPDAVWQKYGKYIVAAGMSVNDPVQSALLMNCSLIAAMASCAWTKKPTSSWVKTVSVDDLLQNSYSFKFYDYNVTIPSFTCKSEICQRPAGTPIYGNSTTSNESWPGVVEKAYYVSRKYVASKTWPDPPDPEEFNTDAVNPTKDPPAPLYHLAGGTITQKTSGSAGFTNDTIFSTLDGICGGRYPYRKILYPAVAWTSATASSPITPKHTYSVLGVAGEGSGSPWTWTSKYIVHRDPFAVTRDPGFGSDMLTSGTWNTIDFSRADGIFALKASLFTTYFTGYAYTTVA